MQAASETSRQDAAPIPTQSVTQAALTTTTVKPASVPSSGSASTNRPTVPPAHVLGQVDKILNNVGQGNVVG